MTTIFDFLGMALFIGAAAMFFLRFQHEDPPLLPYVIISMVCAVSNWLGNNGAGVWAIALLIAASFLLVHIASLPYPDESVDSGA